MKEKTPLLKRTWNRESASGFRVPNFWQFCSDHKLMFFMIFCFLFVTYGMRLSYYSTTVDQDMLMANADWAFNWYFQIGRFGQVLSKWIFSLLTCNPFFELAFTVLFLFMACVAWAFVFETLRGDSNRFRAIAWVFPILFVTSPILAEQMYWLMQSFSVSLCLILVAISMLLFYKWILQGSKLDLIIGILLTVFSFGVYQEFVPFFIAAALGCFLLLYRRYRKPVTDGTLKKSFFYQLCIKIVLAFLASFLLYEIINQIVYHFVGAIPYLEGQILWGNAPVSECLSNIFDHFIEVFTGYGDFYNLLYIIMAVLLIIVVVVEARKHTKGYWLYLLATLGFLLTPFFMTIFSGRIPVIRSQFTLPFVAAFGIDFLIAMIPKSFNKMRAIAAILVIAVAFTQARTTSRLIYTNYVRQQEDVRVSEDIRQRISALGLGETPPEPVVCVGVRAPQLNSCTLRGEESGVSFYELEYQDPTERRVQFMETIGINYTVPSYDQILQAKPLAQDMPTYPNDGCVQLKDGLIIVRLS